MRNIKKIVALIVVLVFSFTVTGCGTKSIAEVNGEKITQTDLDKRMEKIKMSVEQQGGSFNGQQGQMMLKALEQQTLDEMITQTLIIQAAKKEGIYPAASEVKKSVDDIVASFGGEQKFNEALKTYNYTRPEIEELKAYDIARNKLFDKVTASIKVTDNDIKQWYDSNKAQYKEPAKIKARAILVKFDDPAAAEQQSSAKAGRKENDAKKIAEDIIKQLDKGADFAALAKEKSEDEQSKSDGGLIKDPAGNDTYAKYSFMPKEFDDAASALTAGKYSTAPVKTAAGFFVIKLESLTPEKQLTFEEAKPRIQQELPATRKQEKFVEYADKLRSDAKIVNKLAQEAKQQPSSQSEQQPSQSEQQQLPPNHPSTNQ